MTSLEHELETYLVPGVSRIPLEYMSLPELIDLDVCQTPQLWARIVTTLLGSQVLTMSPSTFTLCFSPYIQTSVTRTTVFPDSIVECLIALILLNRLPPQLISSRLTAYITAMSVKVRQLVYPSLLKILFSTNDVEVYDLILSVVILDESTKPGSSPVLQTLFDAVPDQQLFLEYVGAGYLVSCGNAQFALDHLNRLTITPEDICEAINDGYTVVRSLLSQLFTEQNRTNFERSSIRYSSKVESAELVEQMLSDILQNIPSLYVWTQQRIYKIDYMFEYMFE